MPLNLGPGGTASSGVTNDPRIFPEKFTDVAGHALDPTRMGVIGINTSAVAIGLIAGRDLNFHQNVGVYGESNQQGVMGLSTSGSGTGVYGGSTNESGGGGIGVRGETQSGVGVQGQSFGKGVGIGILGRGGSLAGKFEGNVAVTGDLNVSGNLNVGGDVLLANRDICERFSVSSPEGCEPGTVMVMGDDGRLVPCSLAYDARVVGVVSGAGSLRPAVTLGHGCHSGPDVPVALVGTAYCLVDADVARVEVGDLLTSGDRPGHAMKAIDPAKRTGAIIGKALAALGQGRSLLPIVISLQ